MKKRWILCNAVIAVSLVLSVSMASALKIEFSGVVNTGGICTDIDPLPWTLDSVVTWEDWAGKEFSGTMTGVVDFWGTGAYGGPAAQISLNKAELSVGDNPAIDVLAGYYWGLGSLLVLELNADGDWVYLNGQGGAEYLFGAAALPTPGLYISSQHDFGGDNINLGAWYLSASGVSLNIVAEPVPEPATIFLLCTGLAGLACLKMFIRQK